MTQSNTTKDKTKSNWEKEFEIKKILEILMPYAREIGIANILDIRSKLNYLLQTARKETREEVVREMEKMVDECRFDYHGKVLNIDGIIDDQKLRQKLKILREEK